MTQKTGRILPVFSFPQRAKVYKKILRQLENFKEYQGGVMCQLSERFSEGLFSISANPGGLN